MKKLLSVLFLLSFTLASVYAQNIQVKGTVVSGSDNEPLPGVNVVVKGTTNGGITDLDGNFTLSVPADATLSITYIGFKSQEVAVNGKNSLKIVLQEDSETLDEVVVVGYGVQKKSVVTASIAKVSSEENHPADQKLKLHPHLQPNLSMHYPYAPEICFPNPHY